MAILLVVQAEVPKVDHAGPHEVEWAEVLAGSAELVQGHLVGLGLRVLD